ARRGGGHVDGLLGQLQFLAPPPFPLFRDGPRLGAARRDRVAVRVGGFVDGRARRDHDRVAYGRVDREGQPHGGRTLVARDSRFLCATGVLGILPGENGCGVQPVLLGCVLGPSLPRGTWIQHAGQVTVDRRVVGENLGPVLRSRVLGGAEQFP